MNIIGDVKGKHCIIVDDIIDSGGTIINAVDALKKEGAKDVYVFITHAVLSGQAVEKIKTSQIKNLLLQTLLKTHQK
jgi:ribose-phosphate pyrophosphokinase